MATHSSTLAWRIPWTEEPGGLQSTGSQSPTRLNDFTNECREEREERNQNLQDTHYRQGGTLQGVTFTLAWVIRKLWVESGDFKR